MVEEIRQIVDADTKADVSIKQKFGAVMEFYVHTVLPIRIAKRAHDQDTETNKVFGTISSILYTYFQESNAMQIMKLLLKLYDMYKNA